MGKSLGRCDNLLGHRVVEELELVHQLVHRLWHRYIENLYHGSNVASCAAVPAPEAEARRKPRAASRRAFIVQLEAFQFSPYSKTSDLAMEVFVVFSQDRVQAPPAQSGIQKLGAAPVPQIPKQVVDQDEVAAQVVDVPVTMQDKFQQSVPIVLELCLRFSSSTECWLLQRQVCTVKTVKHPRDSTVLFLGMVLTRCCATTGALWCLRVSPKSTPAHS